MQMDWRDSNHVICVSVWSVRSLYNEDLLYLRLVQCSVVKSWLQECGCEEKTLCVTCGVSNLVRLLEFLCFNCVTTRRLVYV
jgi:hypothetical protein